MAYSLSSLLAGKHEDRSCEHDSHVHVKQAYSRHRGDRAWEWPAARWGESLRASALSSLSLQVGDSSSARQGFSGDCRQMSDW